MRQESGGGASQRRLVLADRYRIDGLLAEGGLSRVWSGFDLELGRKVAIKIPRAPARATLAPWFLIGREARLLARIDHPSVVKVFEFGRVGRRPFLVTELIDGVTLERLFDCLRAGCDSQLWRDGAQRGLLALCPESREVFASYEAAMAVMFRSIVDAVTAAHGAGVLHHDIRPSNVLVRSDGTPVLVDFGLGASFGAAPGPLSGCLRYLAPEQIRAQSLGDDPRSDVYQLGLLFGAMLCAREPFHGSTVAETLRLLRGPGAPTPREIDARVPVALDRICARAAAPERDDRFRSASELRDELDRCLAGNRSFVRESRFGDRPVASPHP